MVEITRENVRKYIVAAQEIIKSDISVRKWHLADLLTSTFMEAMQEASNGAIQDAVNLVDKFAESFDPRSPFESGQKVAAEDISKAIRALKSHD